MEYILDSTSIIAIDDIMALFLYEQDMTSVGGMEHNELDAEKLGPTIREVTSDRATRVQDWVDNLDNQDRLDDMNGEGLVDKAREWPNESFDQDWLGNLDGVEREVSDYNTESGNSGLKTSDSELETSKSEVETES